VSDPGIHGRRVEEGRVGVAGTRSLGHAVVDLQDDPSGAVLAVLGFVALSNYGQMGEDTHCMS
jgi:hypothetical protein